MNNIPYVPSKEVLSAAVIGLEFEFYTLMDKKLLVENLEKVTGKKIKYINQYHSEFVPTDKIYKVEPDFSGGKQMCELITGPIPYDECMQQLQIICNWIDKNGWTDEKCAMQVNISFNKEKISRLEHISKIDRLKFCLNIDEDFILKGFEERRKSLYARTIKQIIPIHKWIYSENNLLLNTENWILPNEKYYGVNFTKRLNEYLEFRYMGGRDYEKKCPRIIENTNYFISMLYHILTDTKYTDDDIKKLKEITKNNKKVSDSFSDLESFSINWKNIQLLVDLKYIDEVVKAFWNIIRDRLFDIIVNAKWIKGTINYDTDRNIFQINEAKITGAFNLRDFEFFNCELNGIFYSSSFYNCKINNSHLYECKVYDNTVIKSSKVMETSIEDHSVTIEKSYIDNKKHPVKGTIIGGILRSGVVDKSTIKKDVEIINMKTMKQENKKGKE